MFSYSFIFEVILLYIGLFSNGCDEVGMLAFFFSSLLPLSSQPNKGTRRRTFSCANRALINQDQDLKSVLVGLMLGDGFAEKRGHTRNTRVQVKQSNKHYEYFKYIWAFMAERGLTNSKFPPLANHRNKSTGLYYQNYKFWTYTYSELNWLFYTFYTNEHGNITRKRIPSNIESLLTPLRNFFTLRGKKISLL